MVGELVGGEGGVVGSGWGWEGRCECNAEVQQG